MEAIRDYCIGVWGVSSPRGARAAPRGVISSRRVVQVEARGDGKGPLSLLVVRDLTGMLFVRLQGLVQAAGGSDATAVVPATQRFQPGRPFPVGMLYLLLYLYFLRNRASFVLCLIKCWLY